MTTAEQIAGRLNLKEASLKLIAEYRARTKRYTKSVHGSKCFNEQQWSQLINALENRVDDLGGDASQIYRQHQDQLSGNSG